MVLSKKQVYELNKRMVAGGAPDQKDDIGYNKPDYIFMERFSRTDADAITHEEYYNMILCLLHYKNTQLEDYRCHIEETQKFLKSRVDKNISDALDQQIGYLYHRHKEEERRKKEVLWRQQQEENRRRMDAERQKQLEEMRNSIKFIRENAFEVEVSWQGRIDEMKNFVRETEGIKWNKGADGRWTLRIDTRVLDKFASFMQNHFYNTKVLDDAIERNLTADPEEELKSFYNAENPLRITMTIPNEYASLMNVYFQDAVSMPGRVKDIVSEFTKGKAMQCMCGAYYFYIAMQKEDADLLGKLFEEFTFTYTVSQELLDLMQLQYGRRYSSATLIDTDNLSLPFKPYPFQIEDAKIMLKNKHTLLCSEMGAGKTLVSVLVGESIAKSKLVICPETLRINWQREILQVNPDADVSIIYNAKKCRISEEWNIIGYASIAKLFDILIAQKFDAIFLDEAHLTKSIGNNGQPTSKRGQAALKLAKQAEYCYPMTGTPIPTSNRDIYNLLAMICHPVTMEKWSYLEFGKKYCDGQHTGFGWDFTGNSNNEELHELLAKDNVMIRHLKKDVLPHLKKQRMFLPIEVNATKVNREIEDALSKSDGEVKNFLAYAMTGRRILATEKIKQTIEFADTILSQNKQVIIVDGFNEPLDTVIEHYGREKVAVIRGGMSDKEKFAEVDAFQSGQKKICAMNIIAGGVGINLTAAYNTIFNSYDFTPGNMTQAEDRTCRGDQKELCNIYYMYASNVPLDEVFTQILTEKFQNINQAVDNNNGDAINMVEEVMWALFTKKGTLRKKWQSKSTEEA